MPQYSSEFHRALHQITIRHVSVLFCIFHWFLTGPSLSLSTCLLKGKQLELHIPCAHQSREQIIACKSFWLPTEQGEQNKHRARHGLRRESP